jgi:plasmid stabilization system protein ParE
MAYTVRTLPRAEFDAQQIYEWLKSKSPDGAIRWWLAFLDACDRLKLQPLSHALAPEDERSGREIRQILFKTSHGRIYRALYVVAENEVRVVRIRGPGQPDLMDDELS